MLVTNRFDQAERIGATDLGAVEVSYRFIPAPNTLKESYGFWKVSIRGAGKGSTEPKHFVKIFGGDDIFVSTVSVFRFLRGIERIDSRGDDDGRNV
jgi:hypothetical protein